MEYHTLSTAQLAEESAGAVIPVRLNNPNCPCNSPPLTPPRWGGEFERLGDLIFCKEFDQAAPLTAFSWHGSAMPLSPFAPRVRRGEGVQRRLARSYGRAGLIAPYMSSPCVIRARRAQRRGQKHSQAPKQVLGVAPLQASCEE